LDKTEIINLKRRGASNREVSRITGIDRKTVSRYWRESQRLEALLKAEGADIHEIQEAMCEKPKYKERQGKKRVYTAEIEEKLRGIVEAESQKKRILGATHKQHLTNIQIHEKLKESGHQISIATVNIELAKIRKKVREAHIRQEYDLGQRVEYDFGEVRLDCGNGVKTYHMAVFCAPASNLRWLYLYTNQKKEVFLDSHVRFFEMMGGAYWEVVYDNIKNVVKKFIGRTEKELNPDLIKMSLYYGFKINVTNCFRGNEKGSVEKSIDYLRNRFFADTYRFSSLEAAHEYVDSKLKKMNEGCPIEEEKAMLMPYKPPLELAAISDNTVNTYSFVSVDTVFYSVPEELVGKSVIVKKYHDEIRVFHENREVCRHKRAFGNGTCKVNIYHYLNTLKKKPGALKNSAALRQIPKLKAIFDAHYADKPRRFVEIFIENKHLPLDEIIALFEGLTFVTQKIPALSIVRPITPVADATAASLSGYSQLVMGGGDHE
jgi:transposase